MSWRRVLLVLLASAAVLIAPSASPAQVGGVPKLEVFGGYSSYSAGGSINAVQVPALNAGWSAQFIVNANRWVGVAVDTSGHYNQTANAHSVAFGPQFKLRWGRFMPFGELLIGVQDFGPKKFPSQNTAVYMFGGGVDLKITRRLSVRPFQTDYINTYYGSMSNSLVGFRRQAGMVVNLGLPALPEYKITATCSEDSATLDAGAPVKIVVSPSGFSPKRTLSYTYASTGGTIAGDNATASVDTSGLAPGSYTISAKVVDSGKGAHQRMASCQTLFSVNKPPTPNPPVLTLSIEPNTLISGKVSTITAAGSSPDKRPLTYACTASSGHLTGTGPTFTLDTTSVSDGTIDVICAVSDDRNLTASSKALVKVDPLPQPLTPHDFGAIRFDRDTKRPARVDNEAKGELDRYGDALAASHDTSGVIVSWAQTEEIAAQRAINTKDYLVKGKGIDAARIESRTSSGADQRVELWVVPASATFPAEGSKMVDESKVKAVPRIALKARKPGRKKLR